HQLSQVGLRGSIQLSGISFCLHAHITQYALFGAHVSKTCTHVTALVGDETLSEVTLTDVRTGQHRNVKTHWLFVCIGGVPQTEWAAQVGIVRDEAGYLVTGPDLREFEHGLRWPLDRAPLYLETSMPGVFAAGDVRHASIKRVASAVGEGAMCVALVHRYLNGG
ncbi:NAD(P)/FAD-dependent oxidoreductase, partial [Cupriavidus numazuensis]